ncbi:MAG: hypothetical protein AB1894_03015 [Chloroflexota bacterium]
MAQTAVHPRDSFILRIWRAGEGQAWKGWVQHANSGAAAPIHTPTELLAFIELHTGREIPGNVHRHGRAGGSADEKASGLK